MGALYNSLLASFQNKRKQGIVLAEGVRSTERLATAIDSMTMSERHSWQGLRSGLVFEAEPVGGDSGSKAINHL